MATMAAWTPPGHPRPTLLKGPLFPRARDRGGNFMCISAFGAWREPHMGLRQVIISPILRNNFVQMNIY